MTDLMVFVKFSNWIKHSNEQSVVAPLAKKILQKSIHRQRIRELVARGSQVDQKFDHQRKRSITKPEAKVLRQGERKSKTDRENKKV